MRPDSMSVAKSKLEAKYNLSGVTRPSAFVENVIPWEWLAFYKVGISGSGHSSEVCAWRYVT